MTAHYSAPNRSDRRRCSLILRYVPMSVRAFSLPGREGDRYKGWNNNSIWMVGSVCSTQNCSILIHIAPYQSHTVCLERMQADTGQTTLRQCSMTLTRSVRCCGRQRRWTRPGCCQGSDRAVSRGDAGRSARARERERERESERERE